eukprot:scaffold2061_cov143-Cylindrotheca_fusiformis.AAC.2
MASLELPEGLETAHCWRQRRARYLEYFPGGFKPDNSCGISACSSLVNLVLPLHQSIKGFREIATERSFLRRLRAFEPAVDSYDDLVYKLKHRFDNCPLHKLCYYQSYYPLAETMEKFKTLLEADPSTSKKDAFGMTPLGIVGLLQEPNPNMLLALIHAGEKDQIMRVRNSLGHTPMDYLVCFRWLKNSSR